VTANERGGLLSLVVVAQPHERGGRRAADHRGRVVAQVPEQQGQRDTAPLARPGQRFDVAAAAGHCKPRHHEPRRLKLAPALVALNLMCMIMRHFSARKDIKTT
jgi:hypothetical protein